MSITAIIITRNEQDNLADCIKTLDFVSEIIVVDNCSSDSTVDIAKGFKSKVYEIAGLDFSYLRNIGKEKAKSEWLLYIDADERVTADLASQIKKAVGDPKDNNAFSFIRKNYFLGKPSPKLERMVRLMKKEALIGWQGSLHESPMFVGKAGDLSGYLLHYTHRDLSSMLSKTNEWSDIEAQLLYKSNHPPMAGWRFARIMITSFFRSFVKDGGWKMGAVGLIESTYQAFSNFITYVKLWEKQNQAILHEK